MRLAVVHRRTVPEINPRAWQLLFEPRCFRLYVPGEGRRYRLRVKGDEWVGRDMRRADMHDTDLRAALLWKVNLRWARLDGSGMEGARLVDSDLRGASLVGVDFPRGQLTDCDLSGADLRGIDLRDTVYLRVQWPRGFDPSAHGAVRMYLGEEPRRGDPHPPWPIQVIARDVYRPVGAGAGAEARPPRPGNGGRWIVRMRWVGMPPLAC